MGETTSALAKWSEGSAEAVDDLLGRLYPDLRRLAHGHRWGLATLDSTSDLAQDLCVRLFRQRAPEWKNRGHFFAVAAKLMRRIAVDSDRRARALKRGGDREQVDLDRVDLVDEGLDVDLIALEEALERLSRSSPSVVKVVELRYFAGLSVDETAAVLEIGRATVLRRWRFARAWLHAALTSPEKIEESLR